MADMDAIMEIAERHNLVVVEDCAHAHGAKWRGRGAGTIGDFGSFSMQSSKILTTGEGGVLVCRTQELADRAASIIDCGRPHDPEGKVFTMGANYRMSELHAALGNVALERFPAQAKEREEMLGYLEESLSEIPGVRMLRRDPCHTTRSLYMYGFAIDPDQFGGERLGVVAAPRGGRHPGRRWLRGNEPLLPVQPTNSKTGCAQRLPRALRFQQGEHARSRTWRRGRFDLAGSQRLQRRAEGIDDMAAALRKVQDQHEELAKWVAVQKAAGRHH